MSHGMCYFSFPSCVTMAQLDEDMCNFFEDNSSNISGSFEYVTLNCNYFTENQFLESVCNTRSSNELTLLHMNIRSMCKIFDTMLGFISNISSEQVAISISETWFASETDTNIYFIPGYDLISNNRKNKRGGGVAIYIPSQLDYQVCHELNTMTEHLEAVFIEIYIPGRKNVVIGIIYRPPQGNLINLI